MHTCGSSFNETEKTCTLADLVSMRNTKAILNGQRGPTFHEKSRTSKSEVDRRQNVGSRLRLPEAARIYFRRGRGISECLKFAGPTALRRVRCPPCLFLNSELLDLPGLLVLISAMSGFNYSICQVFRC